MSSPTFVSKQAGLARRDLLGPAVNGLLARLESKTWPSGLILGGFPRASPPPGRPARLHCLAYTSNSE